MATTVQYGQVIIYNALTRDWDEEVIYDQSNTDVIGTKIKMRFAGYIHAQGVGIGGVSRTHVKKLDDDPNNIVEAYDAVKAELQEARKTLKITIGQNTIPGSTLVPGREIFRCEPPDSDKRSNPVRDIDNGPKPRGLHITRVVNDQILAVEWSVECMKLHCDSNRGPSTVLNNRWSISEETDANWFTSRTIRGRMRLSAGNYDPASAFRHIVTPGLEAGFRRERVEYAVSESGLEVEYQITDRQVHDAAPSPATKMNGSFTSSTNDGITFVSAVRVRLEGPPHADKRLLITRGLQIVDNRLNFQTKRVRGLCIIESASITDVIGDENAVEVSTTIREVPGDTGDLLTSLRVDVLGKPLNIPKYNATQSVAPALYGYNSYGAERKPAYLFLLHCYLQSPCEADHEIRGFPNLPNAESEGQGTKATEIIPVPKSQLLAKKNATWSTAQRSNFAYTYSRAETKYTVKPCRAQLPVAATVNEQASTPDSTCVFIDLAPGIATRTITVDAERMGAWPQIPTALDSYTDGDIRGRLLFHDLTIMPSTLSADGQTRVFRVRAFYRWGLNRLPRANEKLKVGLLPFTNFDQESNKVDGNKIYNNTLGP